MQRLFSTFPGGLPGAGLVLLRAAVAVPLVQQGSATLLMASPPALASARLVAAAAALLLLIGLWTPIAGALVAVAEAGLALSHPPDPWPFIQFGALGVALALLGPGSCSVDARLFGRKRIRIPQR